jgi:uncharacterized LabA/DUF88 family protein
MLYIFVDWGYVDRNFPAFFSTGGKAINIKNNIERLLNLTSHKMFFYWPPPYVHNPPTSHDKKLQSKYSRFSLAIGKEKEIEFKNKGKVIPIPCKNCGYKFYKQKEVDILIATDILSLYYDNLNHPSNKFTDLFLLSGDQDFLPTLQFLKDKNVNIYIPHGHFIAHALSHCSLKAISINDVLL